MDNGGNLPASGRQFAAWAALVGAAIAYFNIASYVIAVGGDLNGMFNPAKALALAPTAQLWFRVSMLADCFGFYLPYLIFGGYLWSRFRDHHRPFMDIAALCLGIYVLLGIAGASIQIAALPPLAAAHAGGDAVVMAATESVWLGLVHATERGLWFMEAPVFAGWGLIVGGVLRAERWGAGSLLMVCAALYAVLFAIGFAQAEELANLVELIAITAVPLWMALLGISLLRQTDGPP